MPSLAELQRAMRARVLQPGPEVPAALAALVLPDGLSAAQRLDVYRNNTMVSLTAALAETYPVIRRLVGTGFFESAARAFVRAAPPHEARLSHYGGGLADFLAGYPPARQLPYLADVARLEWAVNEAFYAADLPPLDPARLAGLSAEQSAALRLSLQPSCRLLGSPYPVERIWRANQPDGDAAATIDLGAGGCRLLVRRRASEVAIAALDAGSFALLGALGQGATLAAAVAAAIGAQPEFELAAALQRHLVGGLVVDMHLEEEST